MRLSEEHYGILEHAVQRAAGGRYCGDGPEMQDLVLLGFMRPAGETAWCPAPFFTVTDAGCVLLSEVRRTDSCGLLHEALQYMADTDRYRPEQAALLYRRILEHLEDRWGREVCTWHAREGQELSRASAENCAECGAETETGTVLFGCGACGAAWQVACNACDHHERGLVEWCAGCRLGSNFKEGGL